MDINEKITNISDDYNELIEGLVPGSIPPASRLMKKRETRERFYLKTGRLGMAYTLLIIVFTFLSIILINSVKSDEVPGREQILNAAVFSVDSPGTIVSAFRETVR